MESLFCNPFSKAPGEEVAVYFSRIQQKAWGALLPAPAAQGHGVRGTARWLGIKLKVLE